MENNEHYFYVLQCADKSYYAGYTNNVAKRIDAHNAGKGAKYTRYRTPVHLIYQEQYSTKRAAMQAEYRFKQLTRKQKEIYIKEGLWNGAMDTV
ncbi:MULTISPECIES: GIY-YIG nuclease family protein [Sutcliffiella]|uniref:GIY-YIG domain-containing protein n=1 Tax=Sutcliffiella cohnii TaxID=33932 RepID=A0A223KWW3_9BACI|nr:MULTISPECIES: GIY-YIG nuclease family protein [Sutcliffiella]AST93965.1 hypothetical protein BC6307_23210 [Sutcliffiella cohnii]MED4018432.1 GIY-YIG nuclease family protein [Sutcliffiella cohnii]WBL15168.1 GIY-YIG nuclease family protein [Sutcliffiella sp. NC1]